MDRERLYKVIAQEVGSQWDAERMRCRSHQLAGHSLEDYDGPTLEQIVVQVLSEFQPWLDGNFTLAESQRIGIACKFCKSTKQPNDEREWLQTMVRTDVVLRPAGNYCCPDCASHTLSKAVTDG